MTTVTKHAFEAQVDRVLDLVVHSLYSNKEIVLRELVSNAADAIHRRRIAALQDSRVEFPSEASIRLVADRRSRTLAIHDDGIGMSQDELVENLGTIAKSTAAELKSTAKGGGPEALAELIGRFGVGFYSTFMVADRVDVTSRSVYEDVAYTWSSSGQDGFTVAESERSTPGTTVVLHLKQADTDDGLPDFTDQWALQRMVKKHSDFVPFPITVTTADTTPTDEQEESTPAPVNSMKALWSRPTAELEEEHVHELYRSVSGNWDEPLGWMHLEMDGIVAAKALLFLPTQPPFSMHDREAAFRGLHLYLKQVLVKEATPEVMPSWLRFVKGVVAAEDLPLNVSRETVQDARQLRSIRNFLTKKVMDYLREMMDGDRERYERFWSAFGSVLKEALLDPETNTDKIYELMLVRTSRAPDAWTPLSEVLEALPEDHSSIPFLTGARIEEMQSRPHLEPYEEDGIPVVLLEDRVDPLWTARRPAAFQERSWSSVDAAKDVSEEEADAGEELPTEMKRLIECMKEILGDDVEDVRISPRLRSSPARLASNGHGPSPELLSLMQAGGGVHRQKKVLELNRSHPLTVHLSNLASSAPDVLETKARLLLDATRIGDGDKPNDVKGFTKALTDLMMAA